MKLMLAGLVLLVLGSTPGTSHAPGYYHPKVTCVEPKGSLNWNYRAGPTVIRRGGYIHQIQICKEV